MADMKKVNKAIQDAFPELNIEAVRGKGYVYFDGTDGFDRLESIYSNPVSTPTESMIRMCLENIRAAIA